MISILIPIYNFDASDLLKELFEQSKRVKEKVEIIVYDDHSSRFVQKNKIQTKKLQIPYYHLPKNVGRSRIRNLMSKVANHEFILFLDGDIFPKSINFIQNYIENIRPNTEVIYGGRTHEYKMENKDKLRWKYGYYREDKSVEEREKKPYLSLISNNLLIKKALFTGIYFEESLSTYGHEDTLLALKLKEKQCQCLHIENPVLHMGIDENYVFIDKTELALKNLKMLLDSQDLKNADIKILKVFKILKNLRLLNIFSAIYDKVEFKLKNILIRNGGSLFLFDVYKLGYFVKISQS